MPKKGYVLLVLFFVCATLFAFSYLSFTGRVVDDNPKYARLLSCIGTGKSLTDCRLSLLLESSAEPPAGLDVGGAGCGPDFTPEKYGFSKCENGNVVVMNKYLKLQFDPIPNNGNYVLVFKDKTPHPNPLPGDPPFIGFITYKGQGTARRGTFQQPNWGIPLQPGQTSFTFPLSQFHPVAVPDKPNEKDVRWKSSLCLSTNWIADGHQYEWRIEKRDTPAKQQADGCILPGSEPEGQLVQAKQEFTVQTNNLGVFASWALGCARPDIAHMTKFSIGKPKFGDHLKRDIFATDIIYRMNPEYRSGWYTRASMDVRMRYDDTSKYFPLQVNPPGFSKGAGMPRPQAGRGAEDHMLSWQFFATPETAQYTLPPATLTQKADYQGTQFQAKGDQLCGDQTELQLNPSVLTTPPNQAFLFDILDKGASTAVGEIDLVGGTQTGGKFVHVDRILDTLDACRYGRLPVNVFDDTARKYFTSILAKFHGFDRTYSNELPAQARAKVVAAFSQIPEGVTTLKDRPYFGWFMDNTPLIAHFLIFPRIKEKPHLIFQELASCTKVRPGWVIDTFGVQSPTSNEVLSPGEFWRCRYPLNPAFFQGWTELFHAMRGLLGNRFITANIVNVDDLGLQSQPILDSYLQYVDALLLEPRMLHDISKGKNEYIHAPALKNLIDVMDYVTRVKQKKVAQVLSLGVLDRKTSQDDGVITLYSILLLGAGEKNAAYALVLHNGPYGTKSWPYVQDMAFGKPNGQYTITSYGNNCQYFSREYEHALVMVNMGTNVVPRIDPDPCMLTLDTPRSGWIDARTSRPVSQQLQLRAVEGTVLLKPETVQPFLDARQGTDLELASVNFDCSEAISELSIYPEPNEYEVRPIVAQGTYTELQ